MKKNSTKAQTLISLKSKIKEAIICKSYVFTISDWKKSNKTILNEIKEKFKKDNIIIRSSALNEDGSQKSMAGQFESVKDVISTDKSLVSLAIDKVISSYGKNFNLNDEILVQIMVKNVSMSGVVFTHELNYGSPYFVVNYDDVSGLTDTVTSGDSEYSNRTIYIYRKGVSKIRSNRFKALIAAVKEVEDVMDDKFLDIEFAIDNSLNVFILQVRSITTQPNWNRSITNRVDIALNGISNLIRSKLKPIDGLYGKNSVFGQMPDWNPAEMIGRAPRALAFSLYEKLITNDAWRISRKIMGYSVPEGQYLMISLAGQPFIDTRLSFHSYLPSDLDKKISEKLVNEWISTLKYNPEFHDKIEFEIAVTTFSFDIHEKIKKLGRNKFKKSEIELIKNKYLDQLLSFFSKDHPGSISNAIKKINLLSNSQEIYLNGKNPYDINHLNKLIDECINFGTIPFSILARHGFIAKTLLLSLEKIGILEESDISNIFKSIKTIAGDLVSDMKDLQYGKIKKTIFMEKYGHLRPGTYDIMSQCYKDMDDFLEPITSDNKIRDDEKFEFILEKSKKEEINSLLKNEGFGSFDYDFILKYIHDATAGREYGKFIFTKTVSHILEIISKFGDDNFLSKSELSHIPIDEFLKINNHSISSSFERHMRAISDVKKEENLITASVRLPQILFDEAGIYIVPFQVSQPNFITNKQITEDCINIYDNDKSSLEGKIILIENADPGYDWIFSQNISGLITKYGGANSHMAIRCAEFDIPAAIGCGEQRYNTLKVAKKIMIDCSSSLIKIID